MIKQKSFVTSSLDTGKNNYKLRFDRTLLNIYSDGTVEGDDKLYFTHNLNEELFKDVKFVWRSTADLPKIPDDLTYLEEAERNYKESYVRFKFKPNGSSQFINTKILAIYGSTKVIGEIQVRMGYYSLVLSYRTGFNVGYITNYVSRLSPKLLSLYRSSNITYSYCIAPCWTQNDNANASGGRDNGDYTTSRNVFMMSAYRYEFYDNSERVYGIAKKNTTEISDNNSSDNGKFSSIVFKEAVLLNSSTPDSFEYVDLAFNSISAGSQAADPDARVNPLYDEDGWLVKTSTNFSDYTPYLEVAYKCKDKYIPWTLFLTTQNKVVLLDEDTGGLVNFYFSTSEYKHESDEIIGPIEFSDLNLHFDCYGGTKEVSFRPATYYDFIDGNMEFTSDCDWASFELLDNAISVTVDENISGDEEEDKKYYRTVQIRVDVRYSDYILKTLYINVEQDSDLTNTGGGGGGDDPDPDPDPSEVDIKLRLVNDKTDKDLELNGEVIIYVDDGEGYHVGLKANIPGYDITKNDLVVEKGTSTEDFSVTIPIDGDVAPNKYLGNSLDFVNSKEGCKAYTMIDGGHNSDEYKPYKISVSGGGITFEKNKTYIITFRDENAGTAPDLPLMADFNTVLTDTLDKEKVTTEYTPKTTEYLTSAMDLATSEWNSGDLFNIVNESGVEIVNYRGGNANYESNAQNSMYAWLYAMCLSEIIPSYSSDMSDNNQTVLYRKAYELGGGRDIPLYGSFTPKGDCMVARLVAGIVWAKNRADYSFTDLDTMRSELGGQFIDKSEAWSDMGYVNNTKLGWSVGLNDIFPAAPGPYANGYTTRTKPSEQGQASGLFYTGSETGAKNWWKDNYKVDVSVDDEVVAHYNLEANDGYLDRTIQAVADDTEDVTHMFGEKTYYKCDYDASTSIQGQTVHGPRFTFKSGTPSDNNGYFLGTFGSEVTGTDLSSILTSGNDDTETDFSFLMHRARKIGGEGRMSLLDPQYGRRRPTQGEDNPSSRDTVDYRYDWLDDLSLARLVGSGTKYDANGQDYNLYWTDINGNGKYDVKHLNTEGEWVDAEPYYNENKQLY